MDLDDGIKLNLLSVAFFLLFSSVVSADNSVSADHNATISDMIAGFPSDASEFLGSLLQLFFYLFVGYLLFMCSKWIFFIDDGWMVYPFEIINSDCKYNGKAISNLLVAELNGVIYLLKGATTSVGSKKNIMDFGILPSEDTNLISKLGTLEAGLASISIGEWMVFIKQMMKPDKCGQRIKGILQKCEPGNSGIKLVAFIAGKEVWEVQDDGKNVNGKKPMGIEDLVRVLSHEIAYSLLNEYMPASMTISEFKLYIEALYGIQNYDRTGEKSYLHSSRGNLDYICMLMDCKSIASLFYNLGTRYYFIKDYDSANKMIQKAISLGYNYFPTLLAFGDVLYELNQYDEAIGAYEKAKSLYGDYVAAWQNYYDEMKRQGNEDELQRALNTLNEYESNKESYIKEVLDRIDKAQKAKK